MTALIQKKVATTPSAQGGLICTVTSPLKTSNKEPFNQINTGVGNAPKERFFIGNGVTSPESMSEQAKDMCRTDPAYLASYLDMQAKLVAGATANSFKAHKYLAHLGTWWHTRKARAEDTAKWGEPSPEFMVWPGICYELGPNPAPGKLSIDRIDPTKPYVHGNLRWATKATQAENQRRNRKNAWNDIAITDAQLSAELAKLGILSASGKPHSSASIKQTRYRIKTSQNEDDKAKFPSPDAIHAELLKRLKAPAHAPPSGDAIQDEPFMQGLGIDWEREKQKAPWLTNISFQIQHTTSLEKQFYVELAYLREVDPKHAAIEQLDTRLTAVRDFARQLKNRLQQLHEKKAWKLCDAINPQAVGAHLYSMHVTGFDSPPAIEEEEEEEEFPTKIISMPIANKDTDIATKLSGEALAAHLKALIDGGGG